MRKLKDFSLLGQLIGRRRHFREQEVHCCHYLFLSQNIHCSHRTQDKDLLLQLILSCEILQFTAGMEKTK